MHGDFIWYELMTPDANGARAFYSNVVGWSIGASAGEPGYAMLEGSEGTVGGMLTLSAQMQQHGGRPMWLGYVAVDDVDQALTSIKRAGGHELMPAKAIPQGRLAMVADPQGAAFYVMTPRPPPGQKDKESLAFSYERKRLGHCAWNELMTPDPAAALRFYGQLFGWVKDGDMDMGPLGKYEFLSHPSRRIAATMGSGMLGAVMPMMPGAPGPAWSHYFRVADIDAAKAAIEAQGGRVLIGPDEIPGGDFSLSGVDPQGAVFSLVGARKG
jgi:predicted enzyme related to lactoylglutathione lyase